VRLEERDDRPGASDRRSARAASDQDVAGLSRGRDRRSGSEDDAHHRGAGQAARHPAVRAFERTVPGIPATAIRNMVTAREAALEAHEDPAFLILIVAQFSP
jgi:hypothetical protein